MAYTDIQPVSIPSSDLHVPKNNFPLKSATDLLSEAQENEMEWLSSVENQLSRDNTNEKDYLSWAAFHASRIEMSLMTVAVDALLPMFHEPAHTVGMIAHAMGVVKKAAHHLNPGQTPVIAVDQPLFTIAKQIQWHMSEFYGEDKFIVMMQGGITYRYDLIQNAWKMVKWKWLDISLGIRKHNHLRKSRCYAKCLTCY